MYVYKSLLPNGRKYIGASTKEPDKSKYYFGSHPQLMKDIKDYMSSQIQKEILFETDSVDELVELEKLAIRFHNAVADPNYYNSSVQSGFSNYGRTFSTETRKKMSEGSRGKTHSEQTKRKQSEFSKGKIRDRQHVLKTQISKVEKSLQSTKGYVFNKQRGLYRAQPSINGVMTHLGYFETAVEAHAVSVYVRKQHLKNLKAELKTELESLQLKKVA